MGRGRVEMKRIDNVVSRRTTFTKRSAGLLKKAHELAVLCDADVGVIVFSGGARKLYDYCSRHTSWSELIRRYESITHAELQGKDHDDDQMFTEMTGLRRERDRLEASLRRQTGEDLPSGATKEELDSLDLQLELTLGKVREMKEKLLNQQLDETQQKVNILEDQNSFLRHMTNEQRLAAAEAAPVAVGGIVTPMLPFGGFFPEMEEGLSTSLQLWPQQLTDRQGFGLQPGLRL